MQGKHLLHLPAHVFKLVINREMLVQGSCSKAKALDMPAIQVEPACLQRRIPPSRRRVARQLSATHYVIGRPGARSKRLVDDRRRRQVAQG